MMLPNSGYVEIEVLRKKKKILHAIDLSKGSPLMSSEDNKKIETKHQAKLKHTV